MPVYTQTFGMNEIFSGIWDADTPHNTPSHSVGNPLHPAILDGTPKVLGHDYIRTCSRIFYPDRTIARMQTSAQGDEHSTSSIV